MKRKLQAFLWFLISRPFLLNLVGAILLSFGILWLVMNRLDSYTLHDEENHITLGWYYGMDARDAVSKIKKLGLKPDVDSVFIAGVEPGTVVKQEPYPTDSSGAKVKPGREIMLKVQSFVPPSVEIPVFKGRSTRIVVAKFLSRELKTHIIYVPNEDDFVLGATYKGKELHEGSKVPYGSTITIRAGKGKASAVEVPDVSDMTISQATLRLSNASLIVHLAECAGCVTVEDSAAAFVVRQSPQGGANSYAAAGAEVTLWLGMPGTDKEDQE